MTFEFNWPSGFRGVDVWNCGRTDDRLRTTDGRWSDWYTISSPMSLRLRWAKKRTKIRNWYNQVPHLTQDTNGKVTNSQLDIINKSQEVSPLPAGDHKASINRHAWKHNKHKTEITYMIHKRSTALERSVKIFYTCYCNARSDWITLLYVRNLRQYIHIIRWRQM